MIISIDGASASGKGTLARKLSEKFNLAYLETGLLYRAVGYEMRRRGLDLTDSSAAEHVSLEIETLDLNNPDLRGDVAAQAASKISVFPEVRQALFNYQRDFAHSPPKGAEGSVLDGRDIGTKICPDADFKLFISAHVEERAKRRFKELQDRGIQSIYTSVLEDMIERDRRDSERKESPLKPAPDAHVIDTSGLSPEEVLKKAVNFIESSRRTGSEGRDTFTGKL